MAAHVSLTESKHAGPCKVQWRGFFGPLPSPSRRAGFVHERRGKKQRKGSEPILSFSDIFPLHTANSIRVKSHAVERLRERLLIAYPMLKFPDRPEYFIRSVLMLFGTRIYFGPHKALMRMMRNSFRPAYYFVCDKLRFVIEEGQDCLVVRTVELAL
jgi:hypothetical protein